MKLKNLFRITLFLLFPVSLVSQQNQEIPVPQFTLPSEVSSDAGHIRLVWDLEEGTPLPENAIFELEYAESPDFSQASQLYTGPDLASFISGLPNGDYYYRVRMLIGDNKSEWSEPVKVTVKHQSLQLAFTLFGIGMVVFLSTAFVVLHGTRKHS